MKIGVEISHEGLTGREIAFLVNKHLKEFNIKTKGYSMLGNYVYYRLEGDLRTIINALDYIASGGYEVLLISAK